MWKAMPVAIVPGVNTTTFVRVRPSIEDCTKDAVLRMGRLVTHTWRDPPPRERFDQKPGGHSRKIGGGGDPEDEGRIRYTPDGELIIPGLEGETPGMGHGGHHHGIGAMRWHQRDLGLPDWDAVLEIPIDDPLDPGNDVKDGLERLPGENDLEYHEDDLIYIPNCCGVRYGVVMVVIRGSTKWVYLRRLSVQNWCVYRREWPIFPTRAYATVTGDWSGVIQLSYNGKYLAGTGVVNCVVPNKTLYLEHGCHFGTGGLANCTENPVGLTASMNGTSYEPAASALFGTTCTCIPWYFATYDLSLSAGAGGEVNCSVFHVVITE